MKGIKISKLLFILLIPNILSQLSDDERKELLNKYTKNLDFIKKNNFLFPLNSLNKKEEITYELKKISEIIEKNKFPQNYNFIEDTKAPVHIKNQGSCGSCWAFASTTALSYRFFKQGINVNLSPQYLLSCYLKNCDEGGYLMDTQFYLVKNGTITESCMPYSSVNGITIEKCPSKCKNGEEFKKYYSKNSYTTRFDYDKENYYDVVTLIMDQLINYGPVVSLITSYADFQKLTGRLSCSNIIYKYDGKSANMGGHAVVIVGYGYENSKYYWLIQNSWGENFCNGGFAKIEFAEIGIEDVYFSEPYIPTNSTEKEISVKFNINEDCRFRYNTGNNDNEESFEMNFKSVDSDSDFYYQCNKAPLKNKNEGICNLDWQSLYYNKKGYYKYINYQSLNKNNKFNLDFSSLQNNQFYFYGADFINKIYKTSEYYVSEEDSGILLIYHPGSEEPSSFSKIYPNKNVETSLSDCKYIDIEITKDYFLIHCRIKKSEIKYFINNIDLPLAYDVLCGIKENTSAIVHYLDKTKYPAFRVKGLVLDFYNRNIYKNDELIMIAGIEGNLSGFDERNSENIFIAFIDIEKNSKITSEYILCLIPNNYLNINNNFEISCKFDPINRSFYSYDSIYLTPYYVTYKVSSPFEIIIKNNIKAIEYKDYIPTIFMDSILIKISSLLLLCIFLLN